MSLRKNKNSPSRVGFLLCSSGLEKIEGCYWCRVAQDILMQMIEPTEESQADKGIGHPLVTCDECNTAWRSYVAAWCPHCTRRVSSNFILHEDETRGLMEAVSYLNEDVMFHAETEYVTWEFRNLLMRYASWYDMNSRVVIQACYFALQQRDPNPKVAYAIAFFMAEYAEAPEDSLMYNPYKDDYAISNC